MPKIIKTLKRGEVIDTTPVKGNLVKPVATKFVSLVGLPANQTGFKVVRSDQGETDMSKPTSRRLRRSEVNPVLRLTFPEGTTEEGVKETLASYGMATYVVASDDKGIFTATRSDLQSIANEDTTSIKLTAGGIMATVKRQASAPTAPQAPEGRPHIAVVGVEFDPELFTAEQAQEWLQRNSVDNVSAPAQNPDETAITVKRGDVADGEEVRRLQVEDGVTVVIARADVMSVPTDMVAVVSEAAYGNWGWGQLDFSASMADEEFCEQVGDAIYTLGGVLRNIVFYSDLPIDTRKVLVANALAQFGGFVNTIMDSLPRQVVVAVARSAQPKQENEMKTTDTNNGAGANGQENKAQFVTREDLAAAIAEGIKAHETSKAEELKRAEEAKAKAEAEAAAAKEASDKAQEVQRSAITEAVKAATEPLVEKIAKLEGQTVVRSATTDPAAKGAKPEKQDVFRGALPGIRRTQKADAAEAAAAGAAAAAE